MQRFFCVNSTGIYWLSLDSPKDSWPTLALYNSRDHSSYRIEWWLEFPPRTGQHSGFVLILNSLRTLTHNKDSQCGPVTLFLFSPWWLPLAFIIKLTFPRWHSRLIICKYFSRFISMYISATKFYSMFWSLASTKKLCVFVDAVPSSWNSFLEIPYQLSPT